MTGLEYAGWRRCEPLKLAALMLILTCGSAWAAESETKPKPATSAEATNAVASFIIKPGFRIEVVASEPAVVAPMAMAFDENGRLFVAEMRDYPNRRDTSPHLGRIRVLEDPEGEGAFSVSTVYAEDLAWPSALACYDGGLFVAVTPDILYLKDTKTNGVADERRVVLTGFGPKNPVNSDAVLRGFKWGFDRRFHGVAGGIAGTVSGVGGSSMSLVHSDFAFDPWTLEVVPEGGASQSGPSFDSQGRRYTSDFTIPVRISMYEQRHMARNPFFPAPPEMIGVAGQGTEIYRFLPPGGTNRTARIAPGWMTMARGLVVYRGNIFPTNYAENAFIPDSAAHIIHREVLRDNGLEVTGERAKDEKGTEFLISRDPDFQPVEVITGPDGALYVADFHGGGDQGRIYRIVPSSFRQPKPQRLGKADVRQLAATLAHANGWHRDTAARLLYQRQDLSAGPILAEMVNSSPFPLGRMGALYALDGLGALGDRQVLRALKDTDARVREAGVQLCERILKDGNVSDAVWGQLGAMTSDPSLRVRYQLAFTLGEINRPERVPFLSRLLLQDMGNTWIRGAVESSLAPGAGQMVGILGRNPQIRNTAAGVALMGQLGTMIGCSGAMDEVGQVLDFVLRYGTDDLQTFGLLYGLGDGLMRTRSSLELVDPNGQLQTLYNAAVTDALAPVSPEPLRLSALRFLGVSPYVYTNIGIWVTALFDSGSTEAVRSAVLTTLGQWDDQVIATNVLIRWPGFTPMLRIRALTTLLSRDNWTDTVLGALERGVISEADFSTTQQNFLRTSSDPGLRERALAAFGPVPIKQPEVVRQYRPALGLKGVGTEGRGIFLERCAACHRFGGEGRWVGPDLDGARVSGREKILGAILEPNAEVKPEYQTYVLESRTGQKFIGLIHAENPTAITFVQPQEGESIWPKAGIASTQAQTWSLMPEGMENGMTTQGMADLLEYLMGGVGP